jgi:hypothetical protein
MDNARSRRTLAWAIALALAWPLAAQAQDAATAQSAADVQALNTELQRLKASYADQVRKLRELDARVQALQSRLGGRTAAARELPAQASEAPAGTTEPRRVQAPAKLARKETPSRSVEDVLQQEHAVFDRKFTLENGLTYTRYDRKQLTLNGFLALDAIFLGNIAVENVESDTLTYNLAGRWGVTPNLTLNLDVPYLARRTTYQKGGAGGAAAVVAEESVTGGDIGDITASMNWRLFTERGARPDTVLTVSATGPTGRSPYGIDWRVLERDADDFIRFAVPSQQPTGNGVWAGSVGLSMVKTADPAILFGNFGYSYSFARDFADLDNNPDTVNPGRVRLGDAFYYGAGVAFAFNERTSLSMSYSQRITSKARIRADSDMKWQKVIGSDANAASFNLGVTYALSRRSTLVTLLGIGLTPDAPDFTLTVKIPFIM